MDGSPAPQPTAEIRRSRERIERDHARTTELRTWGAGTTYRGTADSAFRHFVQGRRLPPSTPLAHSPAARYRPQQNPGGASVFWFASDARRRMEALEVADNGTLTLPAEVLEGVRPHTRFRLEIRDERVLLRVEEESAPMPSDAWWAEFESVSETVSRAWNRDRTAVGISSEMHRKGYRIITAGGPEAHRAERSEERAEPFDYAQDKLRRSAPTHDPARFDAACAERSRSRINPSALRASRSNPF